MLNLIIIILFTFILAVAVAVPVHSNLHRRFLHQPLYPVDSPPTKPPPAPASVPSPKNHPKYPFTTSTNKPHFFPLYPSPPPPPPPSPSTFPTFPANISSVTIPQSSSKPISRKLLLALAISLSVLSATLILGFLLYHRRNLHHPKPLLTDGLRLVPPNTTPSDDRYKHPPSSYSSNSSEFLYLGTLYNSRDVIEHKDLLSASTSVSAQQRLGGSPELRPLPPLPRQNFKNSYRNHNDEGDDEDEEDEFFSPRGSSGRHMEVENFVTQNMDFVTTTSRCSNSGSPSLTDSSPQLESSSRSFNPRSTEMLLPPPLPPPLPPVGFWETGTSASSDKKGNSDEGFNNLKPKLKPLHWDKVKASSNRTMVWDHLKSSSSFQLNEEMIETLFMVNSTNLNAGKNHNPYFVMPSMNQENKGVLDHKKSQNISILLRAIDLTIDEICEALFEGNSDTMGIELLESLIKMAPTKDEEKKLKELKDEDELPLKIGPAEKFLKSLLEIPFAFKRIEAMLYIANFDSEFDYLQTSFQTLEAASEELRNNRMFMKLLEAVLRTGNRMNIGTNRGDAHAFKLDTLLKLVDIKGTDGKTTLLHFVVEEIVKSEGSRLSGTDQNPATRENHPSTSFQEEKKLGLQVVSNLSTELKNVKKAASMEYDELINEVAKLGVGMGKVVEVLKLNENLSLKASSRKFSESMKEFLEKAENVIIKIQQQENRTLTKVKEITEYFHGNLSKEEAHPFRIFMIIRDFLTVLDRVCKEVGRITPPLTSTLPVFPVFNATRHNDDVE